MFEFVIFVRNIQNIKRRISNLNLKNESIFKVSSTWKSYFRKVQSLLQLDLYFTTLQGTTHLTCNFRLKKTHKLIHFGQKPKNICHLFFVKKFLIGCQAGQSGLSSGGTYLQLVFLYRVESNVHQLEKSRSWNCVGSIQDCDWSSSDSVISLVDQLEGGLPS